MASTNTNLLTIRLAISILLAVSATFHPVTTKSITTSLSLENPCLLEDDEAPMTPADLINVAGELKIGSQDIQTAAKELKAYFERDLLHSNYQLTYVRGEHFMQAKNVTVSGDKIITAQLQPVETLQAHVKLVYEIIVHIHTTWTTGTILKKGDVAVLNKLENLENAMYRILCDIKIGLRSQGSNVESYVPELIEGFIRMVDDQSITSEYLRIYVLTNDIERLARFLKIIYADMYNFLSHN